MFDWRYYTVWLLSVSPEDSEADTAMEIHATKIQYPVVKALKHTIPTEDNETWKNVAHSIIQIKSPGS